MKRQPIALECGRCGEARTELLTEGEARTVSDGVGPVYRECPRCERTTGWIKGRELPDAEPANRSAPQLVNDPAAGRPVSNGQERLASQLEIDEINDLLKINP